MTRDEVEHEESTNKYILTQGPLVFKETQQPGGKLKAFMLHCLYVSSLNVVVVVGLVLTYTLFMLSRRLHATKIKENSPCSIYQRSNVTLRLSGKKMQSFEYSFVR